MAIMTKAAKLTAEDRELIREHCAKSATEEEFALFINQIERTGLNPLGKQIYLAWQNGRVQVRTPVAGLRVRAERTGKYTGQKGPEWCGVDGVWRDVWLDSKAPQACRVGVLRNDFTEPTWGVARYEAYVVTEGNPESVELWKRMPDTLLANCAEALALRRAFPDELAGLYTPDEMMQSEKRTGAELAASLESVSCDTHFIGETLAARIRGKAVTHGWSKAQLANLLRMEYRIEDLEDLPREEYNRLIARVREGPNPRRRKRNDGESPEAVEE